MKMLHRVVECLVMGIFLLISPQLIFAESLTLPHGWRKPVGRELNDDWRNKDPDKHSIVRGDFNGDGIEDTAMLLVSLKRQELGLFVFVSQQNNSFKLYHVDTIKNIADLPVIGVEKVLPGIYKTACGRGYWKCKKDEMPEITLEHDAINYFKVESANSYFYWEENTKSFKRTWMTD